MSNADSLFFASVDIIDGNLFEAVSRSIAVVGIADSINKAEQIAEKEISQIKGPLFYRKDIGTDELVGKRIEHMDSLR